MGTDLTIELADTAGELGRLGMTLGLAGVNVEGVCAIAHGGATASVHILVDDPEPAFQALDAAGIPIESDQEVLVVEVEDRPGMLGEVAQRLGDAGININIIYLATSTRLVIGADELHEAREIINGP